MEALATVGKWAAEFDAEQHRITVKFNDPREDKAGEQEGRPNDEFPHSLVIDNRLKMLDLKQKICQQLNCEVGEVIIRRGGKAGMELKDLTGEIGLSHFVKGSSIYVEYGCPLNPGEYRCLISLAQPLLADDRNFYAFQDLGEYAVPGDQMLSAFKDKLLEWASRKSGVQLEADKARLRERIGERLIKVYRDRPLKEQGILEKRMISIERTDQAVALG